MQKKNYYKSVVLGMLFLVFTVFFQQAANAKPIPAEYVETLNDREYFARVHHILQHAQKSIYIIMFSANYYDKYPTSPSNILLRDLAEAVKRKIEVMVVLEKEGSGFMGKGVKPDQHNRVIQFFEQHKIPYILDSPEVSTHAKLIIVDGMYTVVGSTNWSYSGLNKNHEATVLIKSFQVAQSYTNYFKKFEIYKEKK